MPEKFVAKHESGPLGVSRTDHPLFRLPSSDKQVREIQAAKLRLQYALNLRVSPFDVYRRQGVVFIHIPKNAGRIAAQEKLRSSCSGEK